MIKKITLNSRDAKFKSFLKTAALTLTKLNHHVEINTEFIDNANLIIIDFDDINNLDFLKYLRNNQKTKYSKILGVYSKQDINKKEIFELGCDSLMTKEEFHKAYETILIY